MVPEERGTVTMLKDITIGQYFPGSSPVHRMDPRFKIIMTLLFIAAVYGTASVFDLIRRCILHLGAVVFQNSRQADLEKHQAADSGSDDYRSSGLLMVDSGDVYWKWHFLKLTEGGVRIRQY